MEALKKQTLQQVLARTVAAYPERPALGYVGETALTYGELGARVTELSNRLRANGIAQGDRVAILGDNGPHWGVAYLAITTMGAIAVPILTDFHPEQIGNIFGHSGARIVLVSKSLAKKFADASPPPDLAAWRIEDFSALRPEDTEPSAPTDTSPFSEVEEEDSAAIIYTSGTTGHSKGVLLTHKNIVSNAITTTLSVRVRPEDRQLSVLPMAHTYECTLGFIIPMMQGCCVHYLPKPPTPSILLPAMAKVKPTMMLTVPLIIEKIYRMRVLPQLTHSPLMKRLYAFPPTRKLLHRMAVKKLLASFGGCLHFFGIGGALLAPDVERFLREGRFPYAIGYGLTETSPLIAGTDAAHTRFRSTGPAFDGIEIKIDKPDPKTGEGEILARGPNVMRGYYNDPERTAEVFTEDGWFRTGDLGNLDKDGYLFIKGRLKNVIVGANGENVYPEEIESLLNEFDYVEECLVLQQQGQLVALVYFAQEILAPRLKELQLTKEQAQDYTTELVRDLHKKVNARLSSISRLSKVVEQDAPFEKTPTKKIKRHLYVSEA